MVASKFSAAMSRCTSEGRVSGLSLFVLFHPSILVPFKM